MVTFILAITTLCSSCETPSAYQSARNVVAALDVLDSTKGESASPLHAQVRHGIWLDMAEIELSVLSRKCLNRRIPDKETLLREVQAWEGFGGFEISVSWVLVVGFRWNRGRSWRFLYSR